MDSITVVIETPAGSAAKYKYDEDSKVISLKKVLPTGMVFPHDFGFIPGTKGEDGDPIDAMVIAEFLAFPGCQIDCRLIGAILAEQGKSKIRNDRFFFIPEASLFFKNIMSLNQLGKEHIQQLKDFFVNYRRAEGVEFTPLEIIEAKEAWDLLRKQKK